MPLGLSRGGGGKEGGEGGGGRRACRTCPEAIRDTGSDKFSLQSAVGIIVGHLELGLLCVCVFVLSALRLEV